MDARSILLAFLPIGATLINYAIIRDLLWGILLGSKSKKSAEKLRAQATGWNKFSQRYIEVALTKYQKEYKTWMNMKLVTGIGSIVLLVAYILLIVLKVPFWIVLIISLVILAANIVLFVIMMNQTASSTDKKSTKGSPWKFEN